MAHISLQMHLGENESCLPSGKPEVVLYTGARAVLWVGSHVAL